MLRTLSYSGYDIIPVIPNGCYGEETRRAVRQLQCELGLEETGIVDRATWEGGCERYRRELAKKQPCVGIHPFVNGQDIKEGDSGDIVIYIQTLLKQLSCIYQNCGCSEINGVFDEKTVRSVKAFQEYNLLPPTGVVDITTWNRAVLACGRVVPAATAQRSEEKTPTQR